MKILLTRDSVCAADDVDAPHSLTLSVADGCTVPEILEDIRRARYLPSISGGKASWVACSRVPMGVLAEQWKTSNPLFMAQPVQELDWREGNLIIHISYLAQIDPDMVVSVVGRLKLTTDF